ncbi:MAG: transposase [Mucilaginibacter sp.]|nr:transposase [Mucilaginibacter sp.]
MFDEMHKRMKDDYGKQMMTIRKSTVEPIIRNLVEYFGIRKVNTIGIKLANKCMIMAGIAYNLKKLIKYGGNQFWCAIISLLDSFKAPDFY